MSRPRKPRGVDQPVTAFLRCIEPTKAMNAWIVRPVTLSYGPEHDGQVVDASQTRQDDSGAATAAVEVARVPAPLVDSTGSPRARAHGTPIR